MIYQKGEFWAIRGYSQKYQSYDDAKASENLIITKTLAKEEMQKKIESEKLLEIKSRIGWDSTPYEIMIEKNICKLCNLEPCECSRCTSKMGLGEYLE